MPRRRGRFGFPGTRFAGVAGCVLAVAVLLLAGCASRPYEGVEVDTAGFLTRAVSERAGDLVVTVAVPDASETLALTGLDLYEQGIQPVWLNVENRGDSEARVATWSIDRHYFSPIEVAYMNRRGFSKQGYRSMERWFHDNGLPRQIPPGQTRSGLVFTHLMPGTKGFNLNVFSNRTAYDFTFFVPMPGFVADFMEVDFAGLYGEEEIRTVDAAGLRSLLEGELACCVTDSTGEQAGGPINVVLVGTGVAVRRSMLRGGWLETSAEPDAAVEARSQHFKGRHPDAIFTRQREDGDERLRLHLWLAPWQVSAEPVWVGQVYYVVEERFSRGPKGAGRADDAAWWSFFARESVLADLDSAKRFLFQNLWYNGSLREIGFVGGVAHAPVEAPRLGFGGIAYFTDGSRLVAYLSETPMGLDETRLIYDRPGRLAAGERTSP